MVEPRESRKLWSGSDGASPAALIRAAFKFSNPVYQIKMPPRRVAFLFGGADRQPVLATKFPMEYIYSFRYPKDDVI